MSPSRDAVRQRILEAAGSEFAEQGFEQATVRQICHKAGANGAAVNYYFGDKQQLYLETVRLASEARIEQIAPPPRDPSTPAEVHLYDHVRTLLERMLGSEQDPWQVKLLMREVLQPTEACRELVEQHFRPRFEYLQNLLDSWLPPGMPDYRRRQVAFSVVGQCVHYRMAGEVIAMLTPEEDRRRHHSLDQLAFHITTLTLASLQHRPIWELDTQLRELLEELAESTSS
ncbi:MAG: CerR family C-terminal domain-containing protein [Planctomycetota bacterium]|nr:CerR family C-terminal domain-containing protein [Planctomycetota bacterium]